MEDNNNNMNVFEYVTIPLAEYKNLIKKVEKLKAKILVAKAETEEQRSLKWEYSRKYDDAMKMIKYLQGETEVAENVES